MKTRTRRNLLRVATATAVVCAATIVILPVLASPPSPDLLPFAAPGHAIDHVISSIRIG